MKPSISPEFLISSGFIKNDAGAYYVNGKRLGHDELTELEMKVLNEFIKGSKQSNK